MLALLGALVAEVLTTDAGTSDVAGATGPARHRVTRGVGGCLHFAAPASTALLGVPSTVWSTVSGGCWCCSVRRLGRAREADGTSGAVLTGIALGPVFSSCSSLYAYVVVTVLPAEPARGMALLGAYVVGLCATLLLVALAGQRVVHRLGRAVEAHSALRRVLGAVFVLVGPTVLLG